MGLGTSTTRMWGRFDYTVDEKYRILIPQRFREPLGDEFVLTMGPTRCIYAYSTAVWNQFQDQFASQSGADEFDPECTYLQRLLANCEYVTLDAQCRLTIPRHLRDWAGIDQGLNTIMGAGSRIELWNKSRLEELMRSYTEQNIASALRRVPVTQDPHSVVEQVA